MKRIYIITALLLLVTLSGCRQKQQLLSGGTMPVETQPSQEEILYNNMLKNYGTWDTFVAKGNVSLGSLSSSFELRMIQGKGIMVSLRPLLGIEIARAVITPDSLFAYEKLSKLAIAQSLDELREKYPFLPTLDNMQSAILGEPFIIGEGVLSADNFKDFNYEITEGCWLMSPRQLPTDGEYLFVCEEDKVIAALGKQVGTSRIVTCEYSDINYNAGRAMPSTFKVTAQGSSRSYTATCSLHTGSFNTRTSIDRLSASGYRQSTIGDLMKSILK